MKETLTQWTLSAFIGIILTGLEWCTGSTLANNFIRDNGLMLIAALIAINVATLAAIISIMQNLEQQYNQPYFFDKSKKVALTDVRELLLLGFILLLLSALVPENYWNLDYTNYNRWECLLISATAVISRMCVLQAVYTTYDFSKSIIKLTTLPEGVDPPNDSDNSPPSIS